MCETVRESVRVNVSECVCERMCERACECYPQKQNLLVISVPFKIIGIKSPFLVFGTEYCIPQRVHIFTTWEWY